MDLTAAARAALLAMIDWLEGARPLASGRLLPLLRLRRPAAVEVVDIPFPLVSA